MSLIYTLLPHLSRMASDDKNASVTTEVRQHFREIIATFQTNEWPTRDILNGLINKTQTISNRQHARQVVQLLKRVEQYLQSLTHKAANAITRDEETQATQRYLNLDVKTHQETVPVKLRNIQSRNCFILARLKNDEFTLQQHARETTGITLKACSYQSHDPMTPLDQAGNCYGFAANFAKAYLDNKMPFAEALAQDEKAISNSPPSSETSEHKQPNIIEVPALFVDAQIATRQTRQLESDETQYLSRRRLGCVGRHPLLTWRGFNDSIIQQSKKHLNKSIFIQLSRFLPMSSHLVVLRARCTHPSITFELFDSNYGWFVFNNEATLRTFLSLWNRENMHLYSRYTLSVVSKPNTVKKTWAGMWRTVLTGGKHVRTAKQEAQSNYLTAILLAATIIAAICLQFLIAGLCLITVGIVLNQGLLFPAYFLFDVSCTIYCCFHALIYSNNNGSDMYCDAFVYAAPKQRCASFS